MRAADRHQAAEVNARLGEAYPDARCELDFENPFQLLVATVLSAQSTDRRVNLVTRELFARYPDAAALSAAPREDVERIIGPVGFFRNKTTSIIGLSTRIVDEFDGRVPGTLDELVTLPGVGRKTANVVLGDAFDVPGITPDTHLIRLANRFGWVASTKPDVVEQAVGALFDPSEWVVLCHRVIWHGRRCCHARGPACGACVLSDLCPSYGTGETDPVKARAMIREPRS
ncbi:endonuclease III [Tessaracoccus antarcticus]|uniref:Endonuclease III n=1 Tax=Tessaracoccus antarcticus TaxID=2479848 RepID=A0A3M0G849_9ACTN|nr:endonuclease III [Tessaracoccus antarcticus]RMB61211.1 endonuclease III [Tessaracoccus antarcticus]